MNRDILLVAVLCLVACLVPSGPPYQEGDYTGALDKKQESTGGLAHHVVKVVQQVAPSRTRV